MIYLKVKYYIPLIRYTYQYRHNIILTNAEVQHGNELCFNVKDLSLFYIQQSNTKTKPAKTIDLSILTKEDEKNEDTTEKPVENL